MPSKRPLLDLNWVLTKSSLNLNLKPELDLKVFWAPTGFLPKSLDHNLPLFQVFWTYQRIKCHNKYTWPSITCWTQLWANQYTHKSCQFLEPKSNPALPHRARSCASKTERLLMAFSAWVSTIGSSIKAIIESITDKSLDLGQLHY